jgi:D-alanine-D-alanine ligase
VGITKCRTHSDVYEGLMEAAQFDRRVLVESGVNGREIEVSVLGNDAPIASLAGEIRPADDFYSYDAKYNNESSELLIPAPIDEAMMQKVREIAVKAYTAIDCAGMARVDFLLDRDTNQVYLNEVNTIPGFTKISMYPKLWDATGIKYPELVQKLIDLAVERKTDRDATVRSYRSK